MDKFKEFKDLKVGDNVFIVYEDDKHIHHILKQTVKAFERVDYHVSIITEKFVFEMLRKTDSAKFVDYSGRHAWLMTTEELAKDRVHSDYQLRAHSISNKIKDLTKEMEELLNEEIIYDEEGGQ